MSESQIPAEVIFPFQNELYKILQSYSFFSFYLIKIKQDIVARKFFKNIALRDYCEADYWANDKIEINIQKSEIFLYNPINITEENYKDNQDYYFLTEFKIVDYSNLCNEYNFIKQLYKKIDTSIISLRLISHLETYPKTFNEYLNYLKLLNL